MSKCPANTLPPTAACLTPHQVGSKCPDVQMSSQPLPPTAAWLTPHRVGCRCPDVKMSRCPANPPPQPPV
eukprot:1176774-Prorocentrum_minimum.AAC.3